LYTKQFSLKCIDIRHGLSKGVKEGHRMPALGVGHEAISGVAQPQGLEEYGMAGLG
jgi:hypothetical protein